MSTVVEKNLSYPIGQYEPKPFSIDQKVAWMADIKFLPGQLEASILNLDEEQLHTPYRDGGWTVQQVVHHVADSHINSYVRFKLALTEDEPPTIKPYYEDRWAELGDSKLPIDVSLAIIDGVHQRWAAMLRSMTGAEFEKTFRHPETGDWTLDSALALYAWHSLHHTAHITRLRDREGW